MGRSCYYAVSKVKYFNELAKGMIQCCFSIAKAESPKKSFSTEVAFRQCGGVGAVWERDSPVVSPVGGWVVVHLELWAPTTLQLIDCKPLTELQHTCLIKGINTNTNTSTNTNTNSASRSQACSTNASSNRKPSLNSTWSKIELEIWCLQL